MMLKDLTEKIVNNFVQLLSASREGKDHQTGVVRPCPPSATQASPATARNSIESEGAGV